MGLFKELFNKTGQKQYIIAEKLQTTNANITYLKTRTPLFLKNLSNSMNVLGVNKIEALEGDLQIVIKKVVALKKQTE
jgi:transcriptional regulator